MLGNGLIRVAVLVDDQVKVRLFHTKIVQRNMRLRTFADRVRQERVDAQTQEDLRGGEVRHLTWTFGAMNHQIVRLNGEMPQIERDMAQLDFAAGRILDHADDFFAHPALKVRCRRVPRESKHQHDQQDQNGCADPAKGSPHARAPHRLLRSARCGLRSFAHGASSPGCSTTTLPCARKLFSQSCSRLLTCCCRSTSRIWSDTPSSFGAGACCRWYSGTSVF